MTLRADNMGRAQSSTASPLWTPCMHSHGEAGPNPTRTPASPTNAWRSVKSGQWALLPATIPFKKLLPGFGARQELCGGTHIAPQTASHMLPPAYRNAQTTRQKCAGKEQGAKKNGTPPTRTAAPEVHCRLQLLPPSRSARIRKRGSQKFARAGGGPETYGAWGARSPRRMRTYIVCMDESLLELRPISA